MFKWLFHILIFATNIGSGKYQNKETPLKRQRKRIYFNIVDLCGILPYKRMYPYKCGIKINFDILTTQKDQ